MQEAIGVRSLFFGKTTAKIDLTNITRNGILRAKKPLGVL